MSGSETSSNNANFNLCGKVLPHLSLMFNGTPSSACESSTTVFCGAHTPSELPSQPNSPQQPYSIHDQTQPEIEQLLHLQVLHPSVFHPVHEPRHHHTDPPSKAILLDFQHPRDLIQPSHHPPIPQRPHNYQVHGCTYSERQQQQLQLQQQQQQLQQQQLQLQQHHHHSYGPQYPKTSRDSDQRPTRGHAISQYNSILVQQSLNPPSTFGSSRVLVLPCSAPSSDARPQASSQVLTTVQNSSYCPVFLPCLPTSQLKRTAEHEHLQDTLRRVRHCIAGPSQGYDVTQRRQRPVLTSCPYTALSCPAMPFCAINTAGAAYPQTLVGASTSAPGAQGAFLITSRPPPGAAVGTAPLAVAASYASVPMSLPVGEAAQGEDFILCAARTLRLCPNTTGLVALHLWRRVKDIVRLVLSIRQGPSAESTDPQFAAQTHRVYASVCLWLGSKLQEQRQGALSTRVLAVIGQTSPGVLCAAELRVLSWLEWCPLRGCLPR